VAQLSEWLQIMLEEIARKQEEAQRAAEEEQRRRAAPAAHVVRGLRIRVCVPLRVARF